MANREKGHPKHADTNHAGTEKKQKKTQPGREGMGGQRPRDSRPGQPATDTTKPRPQKKTKGEGGADPTNGNTRTPPRHRRPPWNGGGKLGTRTTAHTPQQPNQEGRGAAKTRAYHTPTQHTPARKPSPTANTANPSGEKSGKTTRLTQTHPPKTPARAGGVTETETQAQPGPKHKHHTTEGNPVSIARTLRQPMPCR